MLFLSGLLLFVVVLLVVLLLPALWARSTYRRYASPRAVICPESHQQVAVTLDATHAAFTSFRARPEIRLDDCTRWPERWNCNRACLSDAEQAHPYRQGEAKIISKRIYHLPVLLAAFAAWCIGAFWHSHFMFRARWMDDLGLTPAQVKQMLQWYSPHLLTLLVCLLFAYGVAWLLAIRVRRGVLQGIMTSLVLWTALLLVTASSMDRLPADLLAIEFGYTFLAAVVVGAIVGTLEGKLVLPAQPAAIASH